MTLVTVFLSSLVLALSAPPDKVIAWVCFVVAGILAGIAKNWWGLLIAAGLAFSVWPW